MNAPRVVQRYAAAGRGPAVGIALAIGCLSLDVSAGDERFAPPNVDELLEMGVEWAEEHLPPQLVPPTPAEWREFWAVVMEDLEQGTIEQLAELRPYVENALEVLSVLPRGSEYADWLRQRLDYFEIASEAVAAVPEPPPPKPAVTRPPPSPPPTVPPVQPPPPSKPKPVPAPQPAPPHPAPSARPPSAAAPRIVPPAAPVAPAVSEPTERRRQALAHSPTVWRKKMALRPAPERAKALVPRLKQVFRGEGVPPELVWIAEVESSLNPNARNPCGATGLFQFMPATAKRFGLSTSPVDERRDPDKSARAAARYLRELYRQLQAWPLAFAGYNAGEGRVRGLLARHKGRTFEDIAPYLPTETRMYVPKVVAVIAVREGVDAATLPPPATRAATVRAKGPGSRSTAPLIAGRPRPPAATRSL